MKKIFLALGLCGVLNFAQAASYSFTTTALETMSGEDYYSWDITGGLSALETSISSSGGYTIASATLTYNNIAFTVAGPNLAGAGWLYTQLLGSQDLLSYTLATGVTYSSDGDATTDAFGTGIEINKNIFAHTSNTPTTLTENIAAVSGGTTLLTSDILAGFIDIGIDPDCVYTNYNITLSITTEAKPSLKTPDAASTAMLLGAALSGLGLLRRKLNK